MIAKNLALESRLFNKVVLKLENWININDVACFKPIEKTAYVYCELNATELADIHQLEQSGYQFSEFRLKSTLNTTEAEYSTRAFYPFVAEIINEKAILDEAIKILNQNPCDDRFSADPFVPSDFTANRNVHNIKKSFRSWPKEFLLGIFNSHTEELIAFRSGTIIVSLRPSAYCGKSLVHLTCVPKKHG